MVSGPHAVWQELGKFPPCKVLEGVKVPPKKGTEVQRNWAGQQCWLAGGTGSGSPDFPTLGLIPASSEGNRNRVGSLTKGSQKDTAGEGRASPHWGSCLSPSLPRAQKGGGDPGLLLLTSLPHHAISRDQPPSSTAIANHEAPTGPSELRPFANLFSRSGGRLGGIHK